MPRRHLIEQPGQVCIWFDTIHPACSDNACHQGPVAAADFRSREQCVLSKQGNRTNGVLDRVVVKFDPAVLKKNDKTIPELHRVSDCSTEHRLHRNLARQLAQQVKQLGDDWPRLSLTHRQSNRCGFAFQIALDVIDLVDQFDDAIRTL